MNGQNQNDALERSLASLYRRETPGGFETAWRDAVRREEKAQMRTKEKTRFWRIALPSFLALVLMVGTLLTGSYTAPDSPAQGMNRASRQMSQAMDGGAAPNATPMPEAASLYGARPPMEAEVMDMAAESGGGSVIGGASLGDAPADARKIVRTADMTLATTAFDQAEQTLRARVSTVGGYVENFYQYGDGSADNPRRLTMTLRVPTEELDEFLSGAAGIGRVTSKSENAADMTVQYADTALRLETQRGKMERLQSLLARAETVSDLLEIEAEIANTQYLLDAYETSLRSVDRQVENSTVTVTLVEESPAESAAAAGVSLGERIQNAFMASIRGIGQFFRNMLVFLVMAAPVVIGLALIGAAVWLVARRRRLRRDHRDNEE